MREEMMFKASSFALAALLINKKNAEEREVKVI
jgi:hypothetical protein